MNYPKRYETVRKLFINFLLNWMKNEKKKNSFRQGIINLLNSIFCYFNFNPGYRGLICATSQIVIPLNFFFFSESKTVFHRKPDESFSVFPFERATV